MDLEMANPQKQNFESFDRILTGHCINLKLNRLKESILISEVVLEVSASKTKEPNYAVKENDLESE